MKNLKLSVLLVVLGMVGCASVPTPDPVIELSKKQMGADANIQLGMAYLQKPDVRLAKQKFLNAMQLTPEYPPVWYAMAYYLEATGENARANEYYLQAITLAPQSGDAQNNYGTFLCHTGKPQEAISHFLLATQDPDYIDTAASYENAGLCALTIPDVNRAKEYFSKAVTQNPLQTRSLAELAAIHAEQGQYAEAQNILKSLLLFEQLSPRVLQLAANTAKKIHQPEEARMFLDRLRKSTS